MFQLRDEDFIAGADVTCAPAIGDAIDTGGCTAGENYFGRIMRVDETRYFFAHRLV